MIQLVAIKAALSRVPWKLVGAGLAAFALFVLLIRISVWRDAYKALPGVQAALAAEEACEGESKCAARVAAVVARQEQASAEAVAGYERELANLRNRPPAPAVRLCRPASTGAVHLSASTGSPDGTAAGRDVPLETSGDIGQRLFDLADEADGEALKLRFLQDYNRAMATPPK